jgi:L-threonylcarbamoyladenylate synthase
MQIISIEQDFDRAVHTATLVLQQGGVIAFPTETSYGLGCDPRNRAALDTISSIKGREPSKTFPLVACDLQQVKTAFFLSPAATKLAEAHWPGALTILVPPINAMRSSVEHVLQNDMAAVRVSSHPFVQAVTRAFGFPITATSANKAGMPPCRSAEDVFHTFEQQNPAQQPHLILDGGMLNESRPSTIVQVYSNGQIHIVREGAVPLTS